MIFENWLTKWKSGLILCFLNRAKLICSNISLFEQEIEKLKTMLKANDYPGRFFDKILQQFLKSDKNQSSNSTQPSQSAYEYPISLPYLGKISQRFVNQFSKSSISNYIKILKLINSYFQMKPCTPLALCSNVVYKFTCWCDTNLTYTGMSSRHLSTRVREHLNLNSKQKSSIKDHIAACNFCSKTKIGIDSFKIIRKCRSDYDTKIHEYIEFQLMN